MYGSYFMPNMLNQTAPITNGVAGISNLGNALKATSKASFLSKINFGSLLSNAQKTLNVVNQAIPLYYQVKPVFKNIRTLGRIGKEFTKIGALENKIPIKENNKVEINKEEEKKEVSNITNDVPTPTFFL